MANQKKYKIRTKDGGFGDKILKAWVVNILNFNSIPTVLGGKKGLLELVDCCKVHDPYCEYKPFSICYGSPHPKHKRNNPKSTILTDLLSDFLKKSRAPITLEQIDIEKAPHPIKYTDNPIIKGVDVCLVSKTGWWTPYRDWPYFDTLKALFRQNGVSFIDVSTENVKGNNFLNYAKKSKIYLGLETGASHYAAPFVKDNGFIIQSGFCDFNYWAPHYNYRKIKHSVECAPCHKRKGCGHDHKCMRQISPDHVWETISHALRRDLST